MATKLNLTTGVVYLQGGFAIPVSGGGTGISSYTIGDMLYASAAQTLSKLAAVAAGQVLISNGVGTAPSWSASPVATQFIAPSFRAAAASILTLSMDGKAQVTNSTGTAGVTLDFATDSTLKLFARDGISAATFNIGAGVVNGTEDTWTIGNAGGNRPAALYLSANGRVTWGTDTSIYYGGAQYKLKLASNVGANGVMLDFSTAGVLNTLTNAGADTATVKANTVNATGSFSANGTAGVAAFGPAAVASITVKFGLVTAIS